MNTTTTRPPLGAAHRHLSTSSAQPTRAGLIVPDVRGHFSQHSIEARKAEFEGLAGAIRLDIVFSEVIKVREIKPATFIGGGHTENLKARVKAEDIDLLLVDASLTADPAAQSGDRKPAPRCSTAPR